MSQHDNNPTREYRRVLLDGVPTYTERVGDLLRAADGRTVHVDEATHLSPVEPTKIICCHLNHVSRVLEFDVAGQRRPLRRSGYRRGLFDLKSRRNSSANTHACRGWYA